MTKALVILCGGLSTRMHCDKTFLPFGDDTLIDYQIRRFSPYFSKIYLSVPKQEERPIDYESICGRPAIEDIHSQIGPAGGLYSALKTAPEDILFFTSVDAPFTDPALAARLCDMLAANQRGSTRTKLHDTLSEDLCDMPAARMRRAPAAFGAKYACAIRDPQGRVQPLFTAYTKACLPQLEQMIIGKEYRLRLLLDEKHTLVPDLFLPQDQFFNMNDPQSYYFALRKLAKKNPGEFPQDFLTVTPDFKKMQIPVLSFTAKSGTGKTTYLEKLLPLLKKEHLRVAVVKHDAHGFEIDKPGKDSYRLTQAGADHMILTSADQTAAIITHKRQHPDLDMILGRIRNVDLIITEGYKLGSQKKIHLLRKGYNETPAGNSENTIAYVADFPCEADVPVFDLNRPQDLVPFLKEFLEKQRQT